MIKSLVSILIPVYNRVNLIDETIKSALNQSYSNIEVIVVDNCSTDGTWELLENLAEEDKRLRIFRNDKNVGPVRNWKCCIDKANGEFSKILWSDDLIHEDFVRQTISFFENEDLGFVYTSVQIFEKEINKSNPEICKTYKTNKKFLSKRFVNKLMFSHTFAGKVPYSPGCAIFRTESLKKNLLVNIPNYFDYPMDSLAIGNDLLCFLLTAEDYKYVGYVEKSLSYFRNHNESISSETGGHKLALFYNVAKGFYLFKHKQSRLGIYSLILWLELKAFKTEKYKFDKLIHFFPKENFSKGAFFKVLNRIS